MITEPDVALTDYGLALEAALFAYLVYRQNDRDPLLRNWWILFFGSAALASLIGGTVHGFFLNDETAASGILWPATLIAIGVTALAAWAIGASLLFSPALARRITAVATIEFVAYCVAMLFASREFWLALVNYLPAAAFLLAAFLVVYVRDREPQAGFGVIGVALMFAGSWVQHSGITVHPAYFNHNALYHVIQGMALFMIFRAARRLTTKRK